MFEYVFTLLIALIAWTFNTIHDYRVDRVIIHDRSLIGIAKVFGRILRLVTVLQLVSAYRNIYLFWFATDERDIIVRLLVLLTLFIVTVYSDKISDKNKKRIRIATGSILLLLNMLYMRVWDCLNSIAYVYYLWKSDRIINHLKHHMSSAAYEIMKNQVGNIIDDAQVFEILIDRIIELIDNTRELVNRIRSIRIQTTPIQFITGVQAVLGDARTMTNQIRVSMDCTTIRTRTHACLIVILFVVMYYYYKYVPLDIGFFRFTVNLIFTCASLWKLYHDNTNGIDVFIVGHLNKISSSVSKCHSVISISLLLNQFKDEIYMLASE